MSLREKGKQERREKILAAAEKLTLQPEGTSFSMRALAEEAEVSFATPFNLFGSKAHILSALLQSKLSGAWEEQKKSLAKVTTTNRVLALADCVVRTVTSNATLVRPLLHSVGDVEGLDHASAYDWALVTWKEALSDAKEARIIKPDVDIEFYACSMHIIVRGGLSLWLHGELDDKQYEEQVRRSIAAILSSILVDQ